MEDRAVALRALLHARAPLPAVERIALQRRRHVDHAPVGHASTRCSSRASSIAIPAPCARYGRIGCAASPSNAMRPRAIWSARRDRRARMQHPQAPRTACAATCSRTALHTAPSAGSQLRLRGRVVPVARVARLAALDDADDVEALAAAHRVRHQVHARAPATTVTSSLRRPRAGPPAARARGRRGGPSLARRPVAPRTCARRRAPHAVGRPASASPSHAVRCARSARPRRPRAGCTPCTRASGCSRVPSARAAASKAACRSARWTVR